jgi:putative ATP-dependent endonuclease of OLD family
MSGFGIESGIAIVAARVRNFRSLANIEVELNDLTVLIGANNAGKTSFLDALVAAIGANRRSLGADDVRIAAGESTAPKSREIIIDVMIRPIGPDGKVQDTYPMGSFWTSLWGTTGIATNDDLNEFTGIRTLLKWSTVRGEYVIERRFLKEWKLFADWTTAATNDRPVTINLLEPLAFHYIDAKRDLDEDLHKSSSFWRRLTEDLGLPVEEIEEMEKMLSDINEQIIGKSAILKHLKENLAGLQEIVVSDSGAVEVAPVARKLRDLANGINVSFNTAGSQSFPLSRHGMGTRSLAALLVFRAYASWRNKQTTDGGNSLHSILALEEPESHLHPQAQRSLFSHIRQVTGQRIVSTHSPYFAGQASLEDLRLFLKTNGETVVSMLNTGALKPDEVRKLQDTVIATRGDILFSRGVVLFEGQTEEQALPVYASKYWNATIHELGFCFVRVNGTDYFPFVWLAKALRIPWYVFADGESDPVSQLDKALMNAGEPEAKNCPCVVVLPSGNGYEAQLVAEGYSLEINQVIDQIERQANYLSSNYIEILDGKPKKKGKIRDYKSSGGFERALQDYLEENKTRMAKPLAEAISNLPDERRFPKNIAKLFEIIGKAHDLQKAQNRGGI